MNDAHDLDRSLVNSVQDDVPAKTVDEADTQVPKFRIREARRAAQPRIGSQPGERLFKLFEKPGRGLQIVDGDEVREIDDVAVGDGRISMCSFTPTCGVGGAGPRDE